MLGPLFGARPIRNRVQLVGVVNDKPAFEFQGIGPPDWFMKALRDKVIHVREGVCYVRDRALDSGSVVHRKETT